MTTRNYQHKGRGWILMHPSPGKIILLSPGHKLQFPPFNITCAAQEHPDGHISQVCHGPDGWQLKLEISTQALSSGFALTLVKADFEIGLDAPPELCLDLLEIFTTTKAP